MLNILYEDNHIIVVNKPQNVPVQEDVSKDEDMLSIIKAYLKEKYAKPGNVYLGLVHRLDRPTGGVMIFAKTSKAAARLCDQIRTNTMNKTYLAVTDGVPREKKALLTHYLKKNEEQNIISVVPMTEEGAKKAQLEYNTLFTEENKALLKVNLITGRAHQIRVQLKTIGCPIIGDKKYNVNSVEKGNLALWATVLTFKHPINQKTMKFVSYPPMDSTPWNVFSKIDLSKYI